MNKTKLISILLIITLIITSGLIPDNKIHAEEHPYISVISVEEVSAGESVEVYLYMGYNPGVTVAYFTLNFPEQLICTQIKDEEILKGFNAPGSLDGNSINLYWSDDLSSENNLKSGFIATLTFKVKEGTPDGEYPITLSVPNSTNTGKYIYDKDLKAVDFNLINGSITVGESYSGGGSGYSGGGYYVGGGSSGGNSNSNSGAVNQKDNSTKTTITDSKGNVTVRVVTKIDDNTTKTVSETKDKDGNFVSTVEVTETITEEKKVTETITKTADGKVSTSTVTVEKNKTTKETLTVNKSGIYTYSKVVENADKSKTSVSLTNRSGAIVIIKTIVNADKTSEKIKFLAESADDKTLSIINTIVKETTLHIPGSIKVNGEKRTVDTIEDNAFANNKKLKEIFINKAIKNFGGSIFGNCKKLTDIHLFAKSLKNLENDSFAGLRKNVTFSIIANNQKQFNKAVKKIKNAGAPATANYVWENK